jgi:hypothetical protein
MRCYLEFEALYFVKYLQDGFTSTHARDDKMQSDPEIHDLKMRMRARNHRSEQKIARFRTHYFRDVICIREYSNRAKFNTFLLNHLWEIGPVKNDLKKSVKFSLI